MVFCFAENSIKNVIIQLNMSQINNEDIVKLANLALVNLPPEEVEGMTKSVNSILGYVRMVAEAPIADVTATQNFTDISRADELTEKLGNKDLVMQNVRQASPEGFVEVSKVINK